MRSYCLSLVIAGLPGAVLLAVPAAAQVDESETVAESGQIVDETIEEIVVYGGRSGDPENADPAYAEIWREQMLEQVIRTRREEEQQWRNANLTYQSSEESRIVWGYDPKADRDMREDLDLNNMPGDIVKPATLFRANF
jgi:hypothetical protein